MIGEYPDKQVLNFGPILFKTRIEQHILERLRKEGDEMVADNVRNYEKNLAGHIKNQHRFSEETIQWFFHNTMPYFRDYQTAFEKHCDNIKRGQYYYKALWINYMKAGEFNPAHVHTGDLSFAIFIDVPEAIHKESVNHKADSANPGHISFFHGEDNDYSISSMAFAPVTGDMFIFPAKLRHFVTPFKSDVTRISVSGNLEFK
mgnify:CR=1 FL=1|tara:strand:- start:395 stop:1003 length:609 start_codon:yes stop_codon:yes gene_type:complete